MAEAGGSVILNAPRARAPVTQHVAPSGGAGHVPVMRESSVAFSGGSAGAAHHHGYLSQRQWNLAGQTSCDIMQGGGAREHRCLTNPDNLFNIIHPTIFRLLILDRTQSRRPNGQNPVHDRTHADTHAHDVTDSPSTNIKSLFLWKTSQYSLPNCQLTRLYFLGPSMSHSSFGSRKIIQH